MALMKSVLRGFMAYDPGGINTVRGAQIALAAVCASLVMYWLHIHFSRFSVPNLTIVSAAAAAYGLLFITPGNRWAEYRSLLQNTAVQLAILSSAILVGWRNLDPTGTLVAVAWVPVIVAAFYVRRYGIRGTQLGNVAALTFMFLVILNPSRETAYWMPLAVIVGFLSATVLRSIGWRPSSSKAFNREKQALLQSLGQRLTKVVQQQGYTFRVWDLREQWMRLAKLSKLATHQNPDGKAQVTADVVKVLRVLMAAQFLADLFGKLTDQQRHQLVNTTAFKPIQQAISDALNAPDDVVANAHAIVAELRQTIVGSTSAHSNSDDHHLLQLYSGYLHIIEILDSKQNPAPPIPAKEAKPIVTDWSKRVANRLALQGLVAASITTAASIHFELQHGYWATLTVVMIMVGTVGATTQKIVKRAVGTFIGVIAVLLVQTIPHSDVFQLVTALMAFAAIFATLERNYVLSCALVGYAVLGGSHILGGLGPAEEISRAYDTAIGAACGLAAAWLLFPIRTEDRLGEMITSLIDKTAAYIQSLGDAEQTDRNSLAGIEENMGQLAAAIPELEVERMMRLQPPRFLRRQLAYADAMTALASHYSDTRTKAFKIGSGTQTLQFINTIQSQLNACFCDVMGLNEATLEKLHQLPLPAPKSSTPREVLLLINLRYCAYRMALMLFELNKLKF